MSLATPVVFILFNRPDTARMSFGPIRQARPDTLFLVADGPRASHPEDEKKVARTRREVESLIDWPCDVRRIYADQNMGCGRRISSALTEVFDTVPEAIVLEDDCVAHPTFFSYCAELLAHYRDDERIVHIGANNFQPYRRTDYSYFFSKYNHIWGWATWARAWKHYDFALKSWPSVKDTKAFNSIFLSNAEKRYWHRIFNRMSSPTRPDTWDYQWTYACFRNGLSVYPETNLVTNFGDDPEATHIKGGSPFLHIPAGSLDPCIHPPAVERHMDADTFTAAVVFGCAKGKRRRFAQSRASTAPPAGIKPFGSQLERPSCESEIVETADAVPVLKIPSRMIVEKWKAGMNMELSPKFAGHEFLELWACSATGVRYFKPDSLAGDGRFYEQLSGFSWYYEQNKWEYDQALSALGQAKGSLLEVGCATGAFLHQAAGRGWEVMGAELNQKAVAEARLAGLDVSAADLFDSYWDRFQFDAVCSFQVLEHVTQPGRFLKRMLTLLKPGGSLIIGVPNNAGFLQYDELPILNMPPHHMSHWTPATFERLTNYMPIRAESIRVSPLEAYHIRYYLKTMHRRLPRSLQWLIRPLRPVHALLLGMGMRHWIAGQTLFAHFKKTLGSYCE